MNPELKDAADVHVFPPAIPLITILLGIGLDYLFPLEVGSAPAGRARYWVGALLIAGAVLGLGWRAVRLVRGSGQSENPWRPTTEIIQKGPFRVSRNPMYLQMLLVCVGFSIILWNLWILLLVPFCAWLLHRLVIAPEEAYLERKFGETYLAYKRRVRRWI
jgi:protein-S-isoprenylcysteine O-methyltransferase Ste14